MMIFGVDKHVIKVLKSEDIKLLLVELVTCTALPGNVV